MKRQTIGIAASVRLSRLAWTGVVVEMEMEASGVKM